jgi:hypothetical protein
MSDMKYQAIVSTGIKIDERVEIPKELVPKDAQVEITAKVSAGYHSGKVSKMFITIVRLLLLAHRTSRSVVMAVLACCSFVQAD